MRRGDRLIRAPLHAWPKWRVGLAIGAIFRDEARYLPEWIEFHQRQGVERFYLYENNSTDAWQDALAPYRHVVELHHWSEEHGQDSVYSDCIRRHRWDTRWLALIDADEFLFSPTGYQLPDVLRDLRWVAAVGVNWRCYGPADDNERPDAPVVENCIRRARDNHPLNRHIKSISFPAMTALPVINPHHCQMHGLSVRENKDRIEGPFRDPPTANLLRVNHYLARSQAEWQRKLARRRAAIVASRWPINFAELDAVRDPILADTRHAPGG
jgi:hypothetical protein